MPLGLYIAHPNTSTTVSKENKILLAHSKPTSQVSKPALTPACHSFTIQERNRSDTMIRIRSGNIPIIYLEGEGEKMANMKEAVENNLQPVAI